LFVENAFKEASIFIAPLEGENVDGPLKHFSVLFVAVAFAHLRQPVIVI